MYLYTVDYNTEQPEKKCSCKHKISIMEEYAEKILSDGGYNYITQAKIKGLKDKQNLKLDAVILANKNLIHKNILEKEDIKCIIELDGQFHFKETAIGNDFEGQVKRDCIKNEFSIKNKIPLLRVHYKEGLSFDKLKEIILEFIDNVENENLNYNIIYSDSYPEDMRIIQAFK